MSLYGESDGREPYRRVDEALRTIAKTLHPRTPLFFMYGADDVDEDEDANPDGEDSKMEESSGRGAGAESSPSRRSEDSDELHDGDKDDDVMMVDEIVEDVDDDGMDVEDGNVAPDEQVVEETFV